jgi:hypothetical protein
LLGILTLLSAALVIVGWVDRSAAGYVPFIFGLLWVVFVLASLPRVFRTD